MHMNRVQRELEKVLIRRLPDTNHARFPAGTGLPGACILQLQSGLGDRRGIAQVPGAKVYWIMIRRRRS